MLGKSESQIDNPDRNDFLKCTQSIWDDSCLFLQCQKLRYFDIWENKEIWNTVLSQLLKTQKEVTH
jgi:hypothetical protein